jgi:hypothetical protein
MKTILLLSTLLIIAFTANSQVVNVPSIPSTIIGKWEFRNCLIKPNKYKVRYFVFEKCKDNYETTHFPNTVINMRKNNPFSGIRIREFDSLFCIIDTCYPVAQVIVAANANKDTLVSVQSYGKKIKYDYHITKFRNDTLIIGNWYLYIKVSNNKTIHNSSIRNIPSPDRIRRQ